MAITRVDAPPDVYTLVGTGPCYVDTRSGSYKVHFGPSLPSPSTDLYFNMNDADPLNYNGTDNVYVLPYGNSVVSFYVES